MIVFPEAGIDPGDEVGIGAILHQSDQHLPRLLLPTLARVDSSQNRGRAPSAQLLYDVCFLEGPCILLLLFVGHGQEETRPGKFRGQLRCPPEFLDRFIEPAHVVKQAAYIGINGERKRIERPGVSYLSHGFLVSAHGG